MPPDRWLKLTVRFSVEPGLLADALVDLGGTAVEETGDALVTYFLPPENPEHFLSRVRDRLAIHSADSDLELSWTWQPQEDWEVLWRRGLGPRRITPRLIVTPSWERFQPSPGEVVLTLDPGMAFGTAEHATTRSCLRLLDRTVEAGSRLADVGSGSGILAIAAVLLGADRVEAVEMDPMACETAEENLIRNGVADRVEIRCAAVEGGEPLSGSPFDGIVANLQSHLILPLLDAFKVSLEPSGWMILSGILRSEWETVVFAATQSGLFLQEEDEEEGWWTGLFKLESVQG
ncbi:MAG: 50S ribosomal protein L11 methyltransferase [Gemmatimonadetes bacterium]|nr:50S ribosomal protein L11 methyltransferase [Gemmatimonadota bacterium]NNM06476.1 50S ribosomal protein L11 methyltransferase [Gemmatimonadota bacterium]